MHASSWCMPEMRELLNDGRVHLVQGPMCNWRMASTGDFNEQGFVRGKTRWVTSSSRLATLLAREHAGENRAVFDVSRAHFYGVCERDAYVEPPAELHRPGLVAKLNKTMYGTQDASTVWQELRGEHLRSNGFELGASNPTLYRSELVNGFCHGDDSVTAAAEDQIEIFGKMFQEKFDTRRIGMIGAAKHLDKELEVLHRSFRVINDELVEFEADQKHVPQLPILEGQQATLFRSGTMRCAYLAQDRVDISETIKCLARVMSKPRAGHMMQLKRVARYLKGVPRKAQQYTAQEPSRAHLEVHLDSDWAGDTVTRRSTSGVMARRGRHLLKHSSTVQNVIGLSGAESKY